jgi:hypothetical protein
MPSYELLAAYCRTDYRVELPNRNFSIRLGSFTSELDNLLAETGKSGWAIITADNPRSRKLSQGENVERRERLRQRLAESGDWQLFPSVAVCPQSEWPPEHGHLVVGIAEVDAMSLARDLGQHAIVWGRIGVCASLRLSEHSGWRAVLDTGLNSNDDSLRMVCQDVLAAQFDL